MKGEVETRKWLVGGAKRLRMSTQLYLLHSPSFMGIVHFNFISNIS